MGNLYYWEYYASLNSRSHFLKINSIHYNNYFNHTHVSANLTKRLTLEFRKYRTHLKKRKKDNYTLDKTDIKGVQQMSSHFVSVILSTYIHPNCKSWGSFEKFRKFAT